MSNNVQTQDSLKRVLKLPSLIFYGLAFMVPLTIFTTYGLASVTTHGMGSITYLITTVCMAFTAFSYVYMTKAYPVAGSVYTFVSKSMNPYLGFLSGWVILLGYICLPIINYLASAMYLSSAFPAIPETVWVLGMVVVVTIVNHVGITVTDIVNKAIVCLQIAFLVIFVGTVIKYIGGSGAPFLDITGFVNIEELSKEGMGIPVLFVGASILALSFLGFDAISTLSEEAINPEKNIGKAIIITCIGAGIVFTVVTYFLQLAWPTAWTEIVDPDNGSFELILRVAGEAMATFFAVAYGIGCIASSITGVASASRVLYGMGRDGILPRKFFGYLHPKRKTPTYNIVIIGVISLSSLIISLTTSASLMNFGALLGFTMVNLSAIAHYYVREKKRSGMDVVRYLIAPVIGAVFTFAIWINLDAMSKGLGFGWLIFGVIYLAVITKGFKRPPAEIKDI